jgi:tRNA-specific 2-thiouridylase
MPSCATRVVVGLSGGVDSAVAALRLRERGYEVHGLFMTNWDEDDSYCTVAADFQDALAVCRELAIPLHRANFARQYRERVFAYFLHEYRAGRTPNPDVLCNRDIKFGVCLAHARRLGAQLFATGHYARLTRGARGMELRKARDTYKDQSYFLHAVESSQLSDVLFPLGDLAKTEVRDLARKAGLPVFDKPDSTGICFIGERPFREFLSRYLAASPGPILTERDAIVGRHRGLAFYTIGQRAGLEIGGRAEHAEQPWYVVAKDRARNALIVVQGAQHPLLFSHSLRTEAMHWLGEAPRAARRLGVKIRHRQSDQRALVTSCSDGTAQVEFDEPQRAVTPGQFAVFYDDDLCLGGGIIAAAQPALRTQAA